jgi:hypothetical protein
MEISSAAEYLVPRIAGAWTNRRHLFIRRALSVGQELRSRENLIGHSATMPKYMDVIDTKEGRK